MHQAPTLARRPVLTSLLRGLRRKCPRCGIGRLNLGYLTIRPYCGHCAERLGHIRTDDGPAYFTVLIVGHIAVPFFLLVEQMAHPPLWLMMSLALPITLALTLWLLPLVKGALLGLMWAHRLRGDEMQDEFLRR